MNKRDAKGKLFSLGYARAQRAIKAGFYLEAVSLCDSLIVNRLIAILRSNTDDARLRYSVGQAISEIRKLKIPQFDDDLLEDCESWTKARNRLIHGMAHLPENGSIGWKSRLATAKRTGEIGLDLANRLSTEARKHRL